MILCCIFLKHGIQPCIGGSNFCVPVVICKKRWPVGLRHRAQKSNTEKQRRSYFTDVHVGFRFSAHAVKIRISGFKSFIQDFAEFDERPGGNPIAFQDCQALKAGIILFSSWRDEPGRRR